MKIVVQDVQKKCDGSAAVNGRNEIAGVVSIAIAPTAHPLCPIPIHKYGISKAVFS